MERVEEVEGVLMRGVVVAVAVVGIFDFACRVGCCWCLRPRMLKRFLAAREVRLGKCWWTMSLQLRPWWETRWRSLASWSGNG